VKKAISDQGSETSKTLFAVRRSMPMRRAIVAGMKP